MAGIIDDKDEFATIRQLEDTRERSPDSDLKNEGQFDFSPAEQRNIIRRIDRRLVVTVGVMYCVSLMDRTNLANACVPMIFFLRLMYADCFNVGIHCWHEGRAQDECTNSGRS